MLRRFALPALILALACAAATDTPAAPGLSRESLPALLQLPAYTARLLPGESYDPAVPAPDALLGRGLGEAPASGEELLQAFTAIAAASPRVRVERYGESYEGRPLFYAVVGAPARLADLDRLREDHERLVFPAREDRELDSLVERAPAFVWIGAGVHGDEASGADACLGLLYHLAACLDADALALLDEVLVLIDPVQNPDGRARFLADQLDWSARIRSTDRQSLAHQSGWPSGRGNHYFLDLNRDWYSLSQPETRARVRVILNWHPELCLDLHEMGAFDSYLFSPPREPFNPFLPLSTHAWWQSLSDDLGRRFGGLGWSCYRGDWNEEFNPNRGAAWLLHLGAVALLAEQATARGAAVKRPDGSVLSYRETVHHHLEATLSLIQSAAAGRRDLHRDFIAARRGDDLAAAARTLGAYVITPEGGAERARRLAATLAAQGVCVELAQESFRLDGARDYWGEERGKRDFEPGCFIVDLNRGEGRLARAILDFDPTLGDAWLAQERRVLELGQESQLYENTAWSLAMAYGCEVYASAKLPSVAAVPFVDTPRFAGAPMLADTAETPMPYGWLLDMTETSSLAALSGLYAAKVRCWAAGEAFVIEGEGFGPGTLLIKRADNDESLPSTLAAVARRCGVDPKPVFSALTEAGPDMGSRRFHLLESPRAALLAGAPFFESTCGALWHTLDQELSLPVSLLRLSQLAVADLSLYNVILVPDASPGRGPEIATALAGAGRQNLEHWLREGGTLITVGEGNWLLFDSQAPLGSLRPRRQVLARVDEFRREAQRAAGLRALKVDEEALRAGQAEAIQGAVPLPDATAPADTSLAADEYQRRFQPFGAICRVDLDPAHWLCAGLGLRVPVLLKTDLALMPFGPVETPGRFADRDGIRLSGLLWPEAKERWALTGYLCRESVGKGQIIAFLGNPVYRASFPGSGRLLANALLLGPGMGTSVSAAW